MPLVVLSHGDGGWMGGHAGLALRLADAGFVVIAPQHPGDGDGAARAPASCWLLTRPHDLSRAIDFATVRWSGAAHVDPTRVGAFGFSAGAYGALALAGARLDPHRLVAHCDERPEEWACELGISADVGADVGADVAAAMAAGTLEVAGFAALADERVRAAAIAGPALGFGFDPESLGAMRVPLQVWSGELDEAVPVGTDTSDCAFLVRGGVDLHAIDLSPAARDLRDPRIRTVVARGPGRGRDARRGEPVGHRRAGHARQPRRPGRWRRAAGFRARATPPSRMPCTSASCPGASPRARRYSRGRASRTRCATTPAGGRGRRCTRRCRG